MIWLVVSSSACPVTVWEGDVWRSHSRRYPATEPGGSLRSQGRWHRGGRTFPPDQVFATLYTAVSDAVATWELIRHARAASATDMWLRFASVALSRLHLRLSVLLDLRDPSLAALTVDDLTGDDYALPQAIGAAALARRFEGLLVPTATGVGESGRDFNVIVLHGQSSLRLRATIHREQSTAPSDLTRPSDGPWRQDGGSPSGSRSAAPSTRPRCA